MRPDRIRALDLSVTQVTPTTQWIFLEIETHAGLRGVGEATLPGHEVTVVNAVAALAPAALALPVASPDRLTLPLPAGLPAAAARSALDQALWDVAAQRCDATLAQALGGPRRERVLVYANINRRTRDRSPASFAAGARAAIAAGHLAVKLAPFDEATPRDGGWSGLAPGLERIAAVRDAIGADCRLMVDCHWRLTEAVTDRLIAAAAELGVGWLECPLPETLDTIAAIVRLRGQANRHGITLAGLETAIGVAGFEPFISAGAYDVMMPDIKYMGGLAETLRLAERLSAAGIGFSPHNPSGPVCHAISLQLCAAVDEVHSLETQFDETPLFAALVGGDVSRLSDGMMEVPRRPGSGIGLQADVLARHRVAHWSTECLAPS